MAGALAITHVNHFNLPAMEHRVLVAFATHSPEGCIQRVAQEIIMQTSHESLMSLARHWMSALLVKVRAQGATPPPSSHPSHEEQSDESDPDYLPPASRSSLLRQKVLAREQYMCAVSGLPDDDLQEVDPVHFREIIAGGKNETCFCEGAHIIPFAVANNEKDTPTEMLSKQMTRSVILAFCSEPVVQYVLTVDINDPRNAVLLSEREHKRFGKMKLVFDPIGPNQYRPLRLLRSVNPDGVTIEYFPTDQVVTFSSGVYEGRLVPPPDPILLAVHCALGKILHASGMAEVTDELERKDERLSGVLRGQHDVEALLKYLSLVEYEVF